MITTNTNTNVDPYMGVSKEFPYKHFKCSHVQLCLCKLNEWAKRYLLLLDFYYRQLGDYYFFLAKYRRRTKYRYEVHNPMHCSA